MQRLKQRRHSCPHGDVLPIYHGHCLGTVKENSGYSRLFPLKKILKGRKGKRASFSGASSRHVSQRRIIMAAQPIVCFNF